MWNDKTHGEAKEFCNAVRRSHPRMEEIYTQGACLHFFHLFKKRFPNAIPYYRIGHVICRLGDRFYDVTGFISKERAEKEGFRPMGKRANSSRSLIRVKDRL